MRRPFTVRDSVGCSQTLQWRQQMGIFPTRILVAVDGSEEAGLAVQAAAELSKATGSEVHLVHVLPPDERLVGIHVYPEEKREDLILQAERAGRSLLEEQTQRISSEGGKVADK